MATEARGLFLNRDELRELTGRRQRLKMIAWLTTSGYRFEVAADGWPRVLRAALEARLLPQDRRRVAPKSEPDFSAYERRRAGGQGQMKRRLPPSSSLTKHPAAAAKREASGAGHLDVD